MRVYVLTVTTWWSVCVDLQIFVAEGMYSAMLHYSAYKGKHFDCKKQAHLSYWEDVASARGKGQCYISLWLCCLWIWLVYPGVSWFKETQYTKSKFVKWGIHESVFVLLIILLKSQLFAITLTITFYNSAKLIFSVVQGLKSGSARFDPKHQFFLLGGFCQDL